MTIVDEFVQMYRFVVHGFQRSKTRHSLWVLTAYTFGHKDSQTCERWAEQINNSVNMEVGRPKNLLVWLYIDCPLGFVLEINYFLNCFLELVDVIS